MSAIPFTRSLPFVLREQLQTETAKLRLGKVTAVPDSAHVTLDMGGTIVTVPKLASYSAPIVNEPAIVLSHPLLTVAIGAVR